MCSCLAWINRLRPFVLSDRLRRKFFWMYHTMPRLFTALEYFLSAFSRALKISLRLLVIVEV